MVRGANPTPKLLSEPSEVPLVAVPPESVGKGKEKEGKGLSGSGVSRPDKTEAVMGITAGAELGMNKEVGKSWSDVVSGNRSGLGSAKQHFVEPDLDGVVIT